LEHCPFPPDGTMGRPFADFHSAAVSTVAAKMPPVALKGDATFPLAAALPFKAACIDLRAVPGRMPSQLRSHKTQNRTVPFRFMDKWSGAACLIKDFSAFEVATQLPENIQRNVASRSPTTDRWLF
jgi:hypothetical protein